VREDPVISSGLLKLLGVLLVAGAFGFGAYALVGDGVDIDLPELPDLDTTAVTTLANTTLSETTINGGPRLPPSIPTPRPGSPRCCPGSATRSAPRPS